MIPARIIDWPSQAPRFQVELAKMAAGSGGRYHAEDIDAALRECRMQAWTATTDDETAALLLTELREYPQCKVLRLIGCVGTRPHRWWHLLTYIEDVARAWGCDRLEALHPQAWPLHRRGWKTFHVLSEKPL